MPTKKTTLNPEEQNAHSKKNNYTISFSITENSEIFVESFLPENSTDKIIESAASLLYAINGGACKSLCMESLQGKAVENKDCISDIIYSWVKLEAQYDSKPCINPSESLR